MTLFPIVRPRLGLSISADSACLVEIQPKWRGKAFRQLAHQPLPEGLVQLSPTKPNISDPNALSDALGALTKGYKKPQPIVLSLPDVCGRTALFEFSSFPKKLADRKAILSWRFQQDVNLPTMNTRIGFRLYEPQIPSKTKPPQPASLTRVLATSVPNTIIEQYEMACLKAGLLPLGVGLSSLDVFDLFRAMIQEATQTASRRNPRSGHESLFLYLAGWGFSFIGLREGCPTFIRVKSLRLVQRQEPPLQSVQASLAQQDPATTPGSPQLGDPMPISRNTSSASGTARTLTNELVATLQYYLESFQSTAWEGQTLPLYIAEGIDQGSTFLPAIQEIERMLKSSMVDFPHIALIPFSDHLKNGFPTGNTLTPYTYQKALPAYASVMVSS
jgi:hypothetical protein